jgi:hypothetical protein
LLRSRIIQTIAIQLLTPEVGAAFGPFEQPTVVAMPEAAVGKYHCPARSEHHVGAPGQRPVMQTKTEPAAVQAFAQEEFRLRIESPDASHHPAAHLG